MSPADIRLRLDQIRERLATISADRWSHEFTDKGERIVATRAVFDRNRKRAADEAPVVLCSFGPDAAWHEAEFIREARGDMGFVLDILTDAGRSIRNLRRRLNQIAPVDDGARLKNLAAEASIKCGEPGFRNYLRERHATDDDGDLTDSAIAAAVLRRALNIESRKHLNTDTHAAQRWRDMRADYQTWMQS